MQHLQNHPNYSGKFCHIRESTIWGFEKSAAAYRAGTIRKRGRMPILRPETMQAVENTIAAAYAMGAPKIEFTSLRQTLIEVIKDCGEYDKVCRRLDRHSVFTRLVFHATGPLHQRIHDTIVSLLPHCRWKRKGLSLANLGSTVSGKELALLWAIVTMLEVHQQGWYIEVNNPPLRENDQCHPVAEAMDGSHTALRS